MGESRKGRKRFQDLHAPDFLPTDYAHGVAEHNHYCRRIAALERENKELREALQILAIWRPTR